MRVEVATQNFICSDFPLFRDLLEPPTSLQLKPPKMSFNQNIVQNQFPKMSSQFPVKIPRNYFDTSTQRCQLGALKKHNFEEFQANSPFATKRGKNLKDVRGVASFWQNFPLGIPQGLWGKKGCLTKVLFWLSGTAEISRRQKLWSNYFLKIVISRSS